MLIVVPLKDEYVWKLIFLHGFQALGVEHSPLEDWYSKLVPRAIEDGGMYGGWGSYMPQGWNHKWGHLEKSSPE